MQLRFPSVHDDTVSMTTNVGTPVVSNQNSESIGRRGAYYLDLDGIGSLRLRLFALHKAVSKLRWSAGPVLLEDYHLLEKLAQVGGLHRLIARIYCLLTHVR